MITLTVNGSVEETDADPQMPLLHFLREYLNLTGTKRGCDEGRCGACTVLVDGQALQSCTLTLDSVAGARVGTIEAIADSEWHVLAQAWITHQVPQCGFCQSGMLMAAAGLLAANPQPGRDDIRAQVANICRCGTYQRVEDAILAAASRLDEARSEQRVAERDAARRARKRKLARR